MEELVICLLERAKLDQRNIVIHALMLDERMTMYLFMWHQNNVVLHDRNILDWIGAM